MIMLYTLLKQLVFPLYFKCVFSEYNYDDDDSVSTEIFRLINSLAMTFSSWYVTFVFQVFQFMKTWPNYAKSCHLLLHCQLVKYYSIWFLVREIFELLYLKT